MPISSRFSTRIRVFFLFITIVAQQDSDSGTSGGVFLFFPNATIKINKKKTCMRLCDESFQNKHRANLMKAISLPKRIENISFIMFSNRKSFLKITCGYICSVLYYLKFDVHNKK